MRYRDAVAFRVALEDRLKAKAAGDAAALSRDRKRVAFDRLLARMVAVAPHSWVLKGGFALDLRMADRARSTKDIDIAWQTTDDVTEQLIAAATHDAGDFFNFEIELDTTPADRLGGSQRYRIKAVLAGRPFETFVLDVGVMEDLASPRDMLATPSLLTFAGIEPVRVPALPLAQQLAEKLHAYTRTYEGGRTSSRVKDLADLALIALTTEVDATEVRAAIQLVFHVRSTHPIPRGLPLPPSDWRAPYGRLAASLGLDRDLDTGYGIAASLIDPILQDHFTTGRWNPSTRRWQE